MRTISKRLTLRIMMVVLATMAVIASVVYFTVGKYMEDEAMQRFQIVVMREYREIQRKLSDVYVANINSVHEIERDLDDPDLMFDHLEPKYWTAVGAVQQVKKNFEKAKAAYVQAAMLDIHGPKPQYYVAECYLALGQKDDALASLETLLEYCNGQDEVTKEFRAKAEALKKKILG